MNKSLSSPVNPSALSSNTITSSPTEIVEVLTSGTYKKTFDLKTEGESLRCILIYRCKSTLDIDVRVNHHAKNTSSEILVSGILEENARKTCNLTLDFKKGCAGSTGVEREDVFLLKDTADNFSSPKILCSEEDVKGTHGASVGHIDPAQLSYLTSRGLPEKTAKNLLARLILHKNLPKISKRNLLSSVKNRLNKL